MSMSEPEHPIFPPAKTLTDEFLRDVATPGKYHPMFKLLADDDLAARAELVLLRDVAAHAGIMLDPPGAAELHEALSQWRQHRALHPSLPAAPEPTAGRSPFLHWSAPVNADGTAPWSKGSWLVAESVAIEKLREAEERVRAEEAPRIAAAKDAAYKAGLSLNERLLSSAEAERDRLREANLALGERARKAEAVALSSAQAAQGVDETEELIRAACIVVSRLDSEGSGPRLYAAIGALAARIPVARGAVRDTPK